MELWGQEGGGASEELRVFKPRNPRPRKPRLPMPMSIHEAAAFPHAAERYTEAEVWPYPIRYCKSLPFGHGPRNYLFKGCLRAWWGWGLACVLQRMRSGGMSFRAC